MSWIKENYEKAALGGAVAILLGVGAVSVFGGGDKLTSKPKSFNRNDEVSSALLKKTTDVLKIRKTPAAIEPKILGDREIDLFVGQDLYMKDGALVDLYESENVHDNISNEWWRKHGIDPGFANAADRDFDKDGFSNREEHAAGTDPTDKTSYPDPLQKLVARGVDVFKMQMRWSEFDATSVTITYQDNARLAFRERVKLGEKFFEQDNPAIKGRFSLAAEKKKMADKKGRMQDVYEIKDLTPRYAGTDREFIALFRRGAKSGGFNEIQDRSVKLTLNALGQRDKTFIVAEHEKFSLPYNSEAKVKPYVLKSIEPVVGQKGAYVATIAHIDGKNGPAIELKVRAN